MRETGQEKISLRVSTEPKPKSDAELVPEKPARMKIARPSLIAFISILTLFIGWGGWRYFGSKLVDVDDVAAEVDGIESVASLFDSAESGNSTEKAGLGQIAKLGDPNPASAPNVKSRRVSATNALTDTVASEARLRRAEVWLTGTIEVDESDEKIEMPRRISGGPSETSTLR